MVRTWVSNSYSSWRYRLGLLSQDTLDNILGHICLSIGWALCLASYPIRSYAMQWHILLLGADCLTFPFLENTSPSALLQIIRDYRTVPPLRLATISTPCHLDRPRAHTVLYFLSRCLSDYKDFRLPIESDDRFWEVGKKSLQMVQAFLSFNCVSICEKIRKWSNCRVSKELVQSTVKIQIYEQMKIPNC